MDIREVIKYGAINATVFIVAQLVLIGLLWAAYYIAESL